MDSRIEELTQIIKERCKSYLEVTEAAQRFSDAHIGLKEIDKKTAYKIIHFNCEKILLEIENFRKK